MLIFGDVEEQEQSEVERDILPVLEFVDEGLDDRVVLGEELFFSGEVDEG